MPNEYRLLPLPQNYNNLDDRETIRRLTADLKRIVNAINQDRLANPIPTQQDLSELQNAVTLLATREITGTVGATLPRVASVSGTITVIGGSTYATITWADIANNLRSSLDGARIWKADSSEDSNMNFDANEAKETLVACIRTTKYTDLEISGTGSFIYWVQWVNNLGNTSNVGNGITVTIT